MIKLFKRDVSLLLYDTSGHLMALSALILLCNAGECCRATTFFICLPDSLMIWALNSYKTTLYSYLASFYFCFLMNKHLNIGTDHHPERHRDIMKRQSTLVWCSHPYLCIIRWI